MWQALHRLLGVQRVYRRNFTLNRRLRSLPHTAPGRRVHSAHSLGKRIGCMVYGASRATGPRGRARADLRLCIQANVSIVLTLRRARCANATCYENECVAVPRSIPSRWRALVVWYVDCSAPAPASAVFCACAAQCSAQQCSWHPVCLAQYIIALHGHARSYWCC